MLKDFNIDEKEVYQESLRSIKIADFLDTKRKTNNMVSKAQICQKFHLKMDDLNFTLRKIYKIEPRLCFMINEEVNRYRKNMRIRVEREIAELLQFFSPLEMMLAPNTSTRYTTLENECDRLSQKKIRIINLGIIIGNELVDKKPSILSLLADLFHIMNENRPVDILQKLPEKIKDLNELLKK